MSKIKVKDRERKREREGGGGVETVREGGRIVKE